MALLRPLSEAEGVTLIGPAPAALAKLNNRYRWHLLPKAPTARRLHDVIERVLRRCDRRPSRAMGGSLMVVVDPVNLLATPSLTPPASPFHPPQCL